MNSDTKITTSTYTTCSVVMAVYNKDRLAWVNSAVDSILRQTAKSDDIIIVRDGVVPDEIEAALVAYERLSHVTVVRLQQSVGAGEARNTGLRLAKNELVAIMDADDIAVADRLELQLNEFNKNSKLTIVGGQIAEFENTPDNIVSYRQVPMDHNKIVAFSKRRSPFNNMCVCVLKLHALEAGGYRQSTRAEDYNLWLELLSSGRKATNLSQVLCLVRIDDAALGRRITIEQTSELLKLRYKYFKRSYIGFPDMIIASAANIAVLVLPKIFVKMIYKRALRT